MTCFEKYLAYGLGEILPPTRILYQVGWRKHPFIESLDCDFISEFRTGGAKGVVYVCQGWLLLVCEVL